MSRRPVSPHGGLAFLRTLSRPLMMAGVVLSTLSIEPTADAEITSAGARSPQAGMSDETQKAPVFPKPDAEGTAIVSLVSHRDTLVLLMSGDGGWWGDIDAQLANLLAERGYAVIGLDTSIYFENERPRAEIVQHVQRLLHVYGRQSHAKRLVLAGYSFGANMVPLIYNDLPLADKTQIANLIMIAPERRANLSVTLGGRLGIAEGQIDLDPEFKRLPHAATLCVYGADEGDASGCMLGSIAATSRVKLPGGHHFDHDVPGLANAMQAAMESALRFHKPRRP